MKKNLAFLRVFLLIIFVTLFSNNTKAGNDLWTTNGPYGLNINQLIIDPTDSNILYAYTHPCSITVPSIVMKSLDGGLNWFPSGDGIPTSDFCTGSSALVMDPENPNVLYAASADGIYKSIDGAQSWIQVSYKRTRSIAITQHGQIYAGMYEDGSAQSGIFYSNDGGETWELSGTGYPSPPNEAYVLVVAPNAQQIIYAAFESGGLYKSINGGSSWQPINSGIYNLPYVYSLAVDPFDSQVIYVSAALNFGLFRSDNGGASWQPIGGSLPSEPWSIVIDPSNQQVIYAGTSNGVYRSEDNLGRSWGKMNEGMGERRVTSLAIDLQNPQNIYAGTNSSGIWKYTILSGPMDYSISINDRALFTNQIGVTLTLTAPSNTSELMLSNDGGFGGASWEPFTIQKPWIITTYGDYVIPRVVYAKFKTNGQVSGVYQDDIVLDVSSPTGDVEITDTAGISVSLKAKPPINILATPTITMTNNVFLPVVMNSARTGFIQVRLALSAIDDLSGVSKMLISNQANFSDAAWVDYVSRTNWWVPKSGNTTIYVKYRDRAGNESVAYSDTVTP